MSETTPEDHLIILHEFLTGNKTLAKSSSIRAWVNCSRVQVNCSRASVKLHLSCTVCGVTLYLNRKQDTLDSSCICFMDALRVCTACLARSFDAGWYGVVLRCAIPFCFINSRNSKLLNAVSLSETSVSGLVSLEDQVLQKFVATSELSLLLLMLWLCVSLTTCCVHRLSRETCG